MGRSQRHKVYIQGVAADGKWRAEGVVGNAPVDGADGGPLQGSKVPGPVVVTVQMMLDFIEGGGQPGGGGGGPITGVGPELASETAAGAVGRTLATFSATGGTPPYTFSVGNLAASGLAASVQGNLLVADADPAGVPQGYILQVTATDSEGESLMEETALTLLP